jgi:hypothetical protein
MDLGNSSLRRRIYNIGGIKLSAEEFLLKARGYLKNYFSVLPNFQHEYVFDEQINRIMKSLPSNIDDAGAKKDWELNLKTINLKQLMKTLSQDISECLSKSQ